MAIRKEINISKRQRFVLASFFLTFLFFLIQLVNFRDRFYFISLLGISTYILTLLSLKEDIKGIEWFTLFFFPVIFSLTFSFFYFLLPVRWLTRIIISAIYGISFYAILLSENIFNVAAARTIQLHQAALAVFSFFSLFTFFLLGDIIFSFHLISLINFFLFFSFSYLFLLINLWNLYLEDFLEKKSVIISFAFSLILGEIAFSLSFWPSNPLTKSLFLTSLFYIFLVTGQNYILEKPNKNLFWEYSLLIFAFLILLIRGNWGGEI